MSVTNTAVPPTSATCNHLGGTEFKVGGATPTTACNGKAGEAGEPGEPWAVGGRLPSNATEAGAWAGSFGEGVGAFAALSFTVPLAQPLDQAHVMALPLNYDGEDEATEEHENCSGSASNPQAKPGFLCVYTGAASGVSEIQFIVNPSIGGFGTLGAATSGAVLGLPESGSGGMTGTWAVTAP